MNEKDKKEKENCDDIIYVILNEATDFIEEELEKIHHTNNLEEDWYDGIDVGL